MATETKPKQANGIAERKTFPLTLEEPEVVLIHQMCVNGTFQGPDAKRAAASLQEKVDAIIQSVQGA